MPTIVTQVYQRPPDRVVDQIRWDVPSLNMYRFQRFDVGMVEMTSLRETVDAISLTMTFETEKAAMLSGNRLLRWDWWNSLVRIGGVDLPRPGHLGTEGYWFMSEGDDEKHAADAKKNTVTKRHIDPATCTAVREARERGLTTDEICRHLLVEKTTVKRILRHARKQSDYVRGIDAKNRALPRLMRFNEHGERSSPISPAEMRQVIQLLLIGIHYREVAAAFSVCARDVRAMGVRPVESDYDMDDDVSSNADADHLATPASPDTDQLD